jgi:Fe2+ transport system protein FeoA
MAVGDRGRIDLEMDKHMTTMADLRRGQTAEVIEITSDEESRLIKLADFGLVPGSTIQVQQRRPAYVIRVNETLLSLSAEVARDIKVSVNGS